MHKYHLLNEHGEWVVVMVNHKITTEYFGDHPGYENHRLANCLVFTTKEYRDQVGL